jgi:hypothetical protein
MWRDSKNKEVAEKRINDELQKTMKDWGDAKSRYEEDVQRKTENMWFGSNFRARAFVRQTKAKKLDYTRNHLNDSDGSSLLSDSEYEEIEKNGDTKPLKCHPFSVALHYKQINGHVDEDEGEFDDSIIEEKENEDKPYTNNVLKDTKMIPSKRNKTHRAQTAGISKRKPHIPRLIDTSRDMADKL